MKLLFLTIIIYWICSACKFLYSPSFNQDASKYIEDIVRKDIKSGKLNIDSSNAEKEIELRRSNLSLFCTFVVVVMSPVLMFLNIFKSLKGKFNAR